MKITTVLENYYLDPGSDRYTLCPNGPPINDPEPLHPAWDRPVVSLLELVPVVARPEDKYDPDLVPGRWRITVEFEPGGDETITTEPKQEKSDD